HFDKVLLPARRIGQCWEATRAPKQVAEVWGRVNCTVLLLLFILWPNKAVNPGGLGAGPHYNKTEFLIINGPL
ncbi:MAG: hypothetical protein DRP37_04665, partial [Thermodesulfobacteriota bacterium]